VALLGLYLMVPFLAALALITISSAVVPNSTLIDAVFVLAVPFSFVGFAGSILLFASWITPRGKRPFIDPIQWW